MALPALHLHESPPPTPRPRAIMSSWLRHREVLAHLRVDPKTLRARMAENPDHIEAPWINAGSAGRPDYRWIAEKVDPWWMELNRWRALTSETKAGACAGVIPMARPAAGSSRPGAPRSTSRKRSTSASHEDTDGSLAMLVRKRISGRS